MDFCNCYVVFSHNEYLFVSRPFTTNTRFSEHTVHADHVFWIDFLNAFFVYAALLCLDLPKTRVELSDDGVVLYLAGYRVYTPWENIATVGWTPFSRSFPGFIRLKEPAVVATISFEEGKKSRQAVIEKWRWWIRVRQLKSDARYTHFLRIPAILLSAKGEEGRNYLVFSPLFAPAV